MWVFADFGYLLPTITPMDDPLRKEDLWNHYTHNGEFTFQVRARLSEHLDYYLENFAEEGTYGDIWKTPTHDYNYRVFTTQEAFALATAKMVMAIDYRHFKDESRKYPRGEEYHDLLLDIWADSCKLNTPGGVYGPRSEENPNGYGSARNWIGTSWGDRVYDDDEGEDTKWLGSTFFETSHTSGDYVKSLIAEMDSNNIPMSEWYEFTTPREFSYLVPTLRKHFPKKVVKQWTKDNADFFASGLIEVET